MGLGLGLGLGSGLGFGSGVRAQAWTWLLRVGEGRLRLRLLVMVRVGVRVSARVRVGVGVRVGARVRVRVRVKVRVRVGLRLLCRVPRRQGCAAWVEQACRSRGALGGLADRYGRLRNARPKPRTTLPFTERCGRCACTQAAAKLCPKGPARLRLGVHRALLIRRRRRLERAQVRRTALRPSSRHWSDQGRSKSRKLASFVRGKQRTPPNFTRRLSRE